MGESNKPDIQLQNFSISVNNIDSGSGEWLDVTVRYIGKYSQAWAEGEIMMIGDICRWLEDLESLNKNLSGSAQLNTIEDKVHVSMTMNKLGQIATEIEIKPDFGDDAERHFFRFQLDQSYLPEVIKQCKKVCRAAGVTTKDSY